EASSPPLVMKFCQNRLTAAPSRSRCPIVYVTSQDPAHMMIAHPEEKIMDRREFLAASSGVLATGGLRPPLARSADTPGFASPKEAMKAPREKLLFVTCTDANTGLDKPDY